MNKDEKNILKLYKEFAYGRSLGATPIDRNNFIEMIKKIDLNGSQINIGLTTIQTTKTPEVYKVCKIAAELGKPYIRDPNKGPSTREYPYDRESTSIHVLKKDLTQKYLSIDLRDVKTDENVIYIQHDLANDTYTPIIDFSEVKKDPGVTRRLVKINNIVAFEINDKDYIISDISADMSKILSASGVIG